MTATQSCGACRFYDTNPMFDGGECSDPTKVITNGDGYEFTPPVKEDWHGCPNFKRSVSLVAVQSTEAKP